MSDHTVLIIGCGYLGRRLARMLVDRGVHVMGTARSEARAAELAGLGVRPLIVSVTQPVTLAALGPATEAGSLDVYFLVPPGRGADAAPRRVLIEGMENVRRALRRARVRAAVFTSSTAVYGQTGGQTVTADTPPEAPDGRGSLLLEAEARWLGMGDQHRVVRLAGLYGPGRIIGEAAVREGAPLVGNPHAWLNLIHVDDAARLLLAVAGNPEAASIELGVDDRPRPRIEYYRHLARRLGCVEPAVMDDSRAAAALGLDLRRLQRVSNKRCDNGPTCMRTGWRPRIAGFEDGLGQALAPVAPRAPV